MAAGLVFVKERDAQGKPLLKTSEGEEIRHVQPLTSILLADSSPQTPGTLFITTRRLIWLSDNDKEKGYAVDFLSLSLHAISRDPEAYEHPCIYTQIDSLESEVESEDEESGNEHSTNESIDLTKVSEMRLIPSDPSTLESIFAVLCACAELNPDPVSELDGEGDWIFNADDMPPMDLTTGADYVEEEDEYEVNPIGYSNGVEHGLNESIVELSIDDDRFQDAMELEQKP